MKNIIKQRKSSFDVDNAVNVISGLFFAGILIVVLMLVLAIVFGLSIWSTYTTSANNLSANVSAIQQYLMGLAVNFFALAPVIGTILAVVILIAAIVLLVIYVRRMKDSGTGSSASFQG